MNAGFLVSTKLFTLSFVKKKNVYFSLFPLSFVHFTNKMMNQYIKNKLESRRSMINVNKHNSTTVTHAVAIHADMCSISEACSDHTHTLVFYNNHGRMEHKWTKMIKLNEARKPQNLSRPVLYVITIMCLCTQSICCYLAWPSCISSRHSKWRTLKGVLVIPVVNRQVNSQWIVSFSFPNSLSK